MSEKFGGATKTVDGSYDQEFQQFKEYDELINKIKKAEVDYVKVLRGSFIFPQFTKIS